MKEMICAIKGDVPSASTYLQICTESCQLLKDCGQEYSDFPSLSYTAWSVSQIEDEGVDWFPTPEEYDPGLSVEDWRALLADAEVFDENSLTVMQRIYEMGGQATCKELSDQYGEDPGFYNVISSKLAKRVHKKTDCPLIKDEISDNAKWWPILYVGHPAGKDTKGAYVWRLRDELKEALETMEQKVTNSWLLAWNPKNYDWENLEEPFSLDTMFNRVKSRGGYYDCWRCMSSKIKCGDLLYIMKLGKEPKGIFAAGYAISDSYIDDEEVRVVDALLTKAIDFRTESIISQQKLKELFPNQQWSPQGSGVAIKPDAARWLIEHWDSFQDKDDSESESDWEDWDEPENEPVIWKISHGTNSNGIPEHLRSVLEAKHVVVVNQGTMRLAPQSISQGQAYMEEIKKGDYFFLCYAGEIVLLGQFTEDKPKLNDDMVQEWNDYDWYERSYRVIARSLDHNKYTGKKKLWTSNYNSTCVKVTDNALFEELILEPYFGLKLSDLQTAEYHEPYTKDDFLHDVFLSEPEYDKLSALLRRKKNIILQGAPGVGKTYSAKRLAYAMMGEKDDSRIEFVQFHQSYSYEDFIMGYRPTEDGGFILTEGVFYRFCDKARNDPDKPYFFIIDEINRGNLSKIFGELLMLIEADKRGAEYKLNLVYDNKPFYIPENLHMIGMMNTADRSLAMIDYALRRRFSFYTMQPAFEHAAVNGFKTYTDQIACERYHTIIAKIRELNAAIRKDTTLGKGFEIGHSYFVPEKTADVDDAWVRNVVEYEIVPLLEEYWFDNNENVDKWANTLYQAIGEDYDS